MHFYGRLTDASLRGRTACVLFSTNSVAGEVRVLFVFIQLFAINVSLSGYTNFSCKRFDWIVPGQSPDVELREKSPALLGLGDALDAERERGEAAAEFEFTLLVFDR
ncbi:MAG: hypothetical protein K0R17_2533 [Rariglobus sp.]|nr:hypothetical protein [Rariglobus sp.]